LFNQGVDDMSTVSSRDVSTTQKIVRIVQRFQSSTAQGPEPVKIQRKTKAELQAEASAKAAEQASNDLENAIHEYSNLLKNEKTQMLDKLVLLLTVLKKVPSQAKLTAEHVFKLCVMQRCEGDLLKVIRHFFTASDDVNNFDWDKRTYVPSGPRLRGVKRQHKELIALPIFWYEKFRHMLQNVSGSDSLKDEASRTAEQIREWAYYCQLAEQNNLSRFRTFVNVKNHFARAGKIVSPPVGAAGPGMVEFDDDLVTRYTAEMTMRSSESAGKPAASAVSDDSESSGSEGSVDFSLQMRRFQPMSLVDMRAPENASTLVSVPNRVAVSKKSTVAISDSGSDSDGADGRGYHIQGGAAALRPFPQARVTAASKAESSAPARRALAQALAPNLLFSAMRSGSATQIAARRNDLLHYGSGSDESDR
jgi:hypothetical protein